VLQDLSYNKILGYSLKFAVNTGLAMSCGICFSLVSNTATVPLSNAANQLHIIAIAAVVKKEL
jgi:thiosulfate reductase cytochrome b subunit